MMKDKNLSKHDLYRAAVAADNAFRDALEAEYGSRACDMRYAPSWEYPETVAVAEAAFLAACEAWREAMCGA